jgi:hypothetical protein
LCSRGKPGTDTPTVWIVDDNEDLARTLYERTCGDSRPTNLRCNVWYDGSDWLFFINSESMSPHEVKTVSSKLGDPQECGS